MLKNQESSGTEFQRKVVRWPTTVMAKELPSRQKEKPHGKKNNLMAKRKTLRQKRIISWQTEKKNLTANNNVTAKRITSRQKEKDSRQKDFCR